MNVERKFRWTRVRLPRTGVAAILLLLTAAPVQAGWKSPSPGATAAGGVVAVGLGHSLRKNLGESVDRLGEMFNAVARGDTEEVKRLSEESDRLSGRVVRDAFPVLGVLSGAFDTSRAAVEKLEAKLRSAERKIGRFVGKAGERTVDARAALAIDEDERQWYESEGGILDGGPLPVVRTPPPSDAPVHVVASPMGDEDDDLPFRQERGSNPVGEYALRCGGGQGISVYSGGLYAHWKTLMEKHSGDCPADAPSRSEWSDMFDETAVTDPWAPERDTQLAEDSLPDDWGTAMQISSVESEGIDDAPDDYDAALADVYGDDPTASADDGYGAALEALERRQVEAERQRRERVRAAEEAKRQEEAQARDEAERRRQVTREYQRKAAERRRRELEEEIAESRRHQQFLDDAFDQSVQMFNQQLDILEAIRAQQDGSAGSGGDYYCGGRGACE